MKKIITLIAIIFSLNASAQKDTSQVFNLKITELELNNAWSVLEFAKSALPTSEAPAKQVTDALKFIAQLQAILSKQYNEQKKK